MVDSGLFGPINSAVLPVFFLINMWLTSLSIFIAFFTPIIENECLLYRPLSPATPSKNLIHICFGPMFSQHPPYLFPTTSCSVPL